MSKEQRWSCTVPAPLLLASLGSEVGNGWAGHSNKRDADGPSPPGWDSRSCSVSAELGARVVGYDDIARREGAEVVEHRTPDGVC